MLKIVGLLGAALTMAQSGLAMPFQENCRDLLAANGERVARLYYEFIDGGDEMYGGHAPIHRDAWSKLDNREKCAVAEKALNRPQFVLRYPGTFSGPKTSDLRLLRGLDAVESFACDCMLVTSYAELLELPSLKSVKLDVFAHADGYKMGVWSVFDALIHTKKVSTFSSVVEDIDRFRLELDLARKFGHYHDLEGTQASVELGFITEEFLYEHFAR